MEKTCPIDYACSDCGPFTAMRAMAEFLAPIACPDCGAAASRTFGRAPAIAGLSGVQRPAAFAGIDIIGQGSPKAAHPAGCGCCARRAPLPGALANSGRVFASSGPRAPSGR
ncbi:zinc ribbon domain-containing protein [Devosia aurantiaca]|uniref:Zinc ribbon domain-containing protein n=1 Tax=Devosia aurantiaca TaxID=2714858 RepID=A0A6M1SAP9_9HYPH|nr:zinc ribbon domain-containing protein [Devosia aurantiaca]NGP17009.1 zinc ribbon domain-containing protein [Devosia aurantiaca]